MFIIALRTYPFKMKLIVWQAVRRFTNEILGVKGLLQLGSFIIMINLYATVLIKERPKFVN